MTKLVESFPFETDEEGNFVDDEGYPIEHYATIDWRTSIEEALGEVNELLATNNLELVSHPTDGGFVTITVRPKQ